jgi:hypothetical protein
MAKWLQVLALFCLIGCGKKDLNKDLKPLDPNVGKPTPVKDAGKDDSARALK